MDPLELTHQTRFLDKSVQWAVIRRNQHTDRLQFDAMVDFQWTANGPLRAMDRRVLIPRNTKPWRRKRKKTQEPGFSTG